MIELTIGLLVLAIIFAVIFGRNARQKTRTGRRSGPQKRLKPD